MILRPTVNMRLAFLSLLLAPSISAEPIAGAWETFVAKPNAEAWSLYSYHDQKIAPPPWIDPQTDNNPYVYSNFLGGKGVWFIADDFTARGAFVGDYSAKKISAVDVSVSVDPEEIDYIDLVVFTDGPNGMDYYYSLAVFPEDLGTLPDWYDLRFSFNKNWFSLKNGVYTPFLPTKAFLSSIQEVGIRFFPSSKITATSFVGIDDFILVPTVEAPELLTSATGGNFVLRFTANPGVSTTIETLKPDFQWETVPGTSGLLGSQTFVTPIVPGYGLYRVAAREKLTQVVSP